jgi:hypothetical protein
MKRLFAIVVMLASASVGGAQTSAVIVFKGAQLIDGTGAPPIKKSILVIEGDRITAVGKEGKVHYPKNARVIELEDARSCRELSMGTGISGS